jgi:hypothetical protein
MKPLPKNSAAALHRFGLSSYPTMTVASIRALHELLSNVPPATSSSCSSLTASGFWISSLILGFGWWCWLGWVGSAADLNWYRRERQMSYPTMTVASIRALQELLSNVPPATSSSCSSLTASGFWISSLILGFGWWCWLGWVGSAADLNWYRRERRTSYPTMTVASIRALQELLSNVPPATSSSCSSLTVSKFLVSSLILLVSI